MKALQTLAVAVIAIVVVIGLAVSTTTVAFGQQEQSAGESAVTVTAEAPIVANETYFIGSEIESYIIGQLLASNLDELKFYEDGRAVATFHNPSNIYGEGMEIHYNSTVTKEYGYVFENGTIIYEPTGTEVQIVLDEE